VLDPAANAKGRQVISRQDSTAELYVIPTDEELMIAQHTLALISGTPAQSQPDRVSA
jgi:acetate kinase